MPSNFCPNCGSAIVQGKKFCGSCGAPLNAEAEPAVSSPTSGQLGSQPAYQQLAYQQPAYQQPSYPRQPTPVHKKHRGRTALIVAGCIVVFFVIVGIAASFILNNTAGMDYYKLGNDQITSVKHVVGSRPVSRMETSTSGGVATMTLIYDESKYDPQQDLNDYFDYLKSNDGFSVTQSYDLNTVPGTAQLAKPSADDGQVIILDVTYDKSGFSLVFTKGKGTFSAG